MSGKRTIKEIVEYLRKCHTNTIVDCLVKLAADNLADKLEDALRIEESKHREEVKSLQATIKKLNDALTEQSGKLGNNAAIRKEATMANNKLREALETLLNLAYEVQDANSECGPKTCISAQFIIDTAKSALAEPPRNCDRFQTKEDAAMAFNKERSVFIPQSILWQLGEWLDWLFAPATEKKGVAS